MDIRIGKQLTQAREAQGLIVEDVAHRTRIPAATIRQLESEDYSHFPNNVYAKGFLRLYCKHLAVDPSDYIAVRDGRLMSHEDEVAFLDGIAVSTEFQNIDEKQQSSEEAEAASLAEGAPVPGKISNGMRTVLLLVLVGIPTAYFLSQLYKRAKDDGGEPGDNIPAAASPEGSGATTTPPPTPPPAEAPPTGIVGEGEVTEPEPAPEATVDPVEAPPATPVIDDDQEIPRAISLDSASLETTELPAATPVPTAIE